MAANSVAVWGGVAPWSVTRLASSRAASSGSSVILMVVTVSRSARAANSALRTRKQLGSRMNGPAACSSSPSLGWKESMSLRLLLRRQQQPNQGIGSGFRSVVCTQVADSDSSITFNAGINSVSSKVVLVFGATGGVGES
jgi:hypothetical protein